MALKRNNECIEVSRCNFGKIVVNFDEWMHFPCHGHGSAGGMNALLTSTALASVMVYQESFILSSHEKDKARGW